MRKSLPKERSLSVEDVPRRRLSWIYAAFVAFSSIAGLTFGFIKLSDDRHGRAIWTLALLSLAVVIAIGWTLGLSAWRRFLRRLTEDTGDIVPALIGREAIETGPFRSRRSAGIEKGAVRTTGDTLTFWSRSKFRPISATVVLSDAVDTVKIDQLIYGVLEFRALTVTMIIRDEETTLTFAPVIAGAFSVNAVEDAQFVEIKRRLDALAEARRR